MRSLASPVPDVPPFTPRSNPVTTNLPRMMPKPLPLAAAALTLLAVAGCGSSGGGTPARSGSPSPAAHATNHAARAPHTAGKVLLRLSGSGVRDSMPVSVPGTVYAKYSYNCAAFGSRGNFQASLETSKSGLGADDQQIANALGMHGTQTTTVYPQDTGQKYHLDVNSECSWKITLRG